MDTYKNGRNNTRDPGAYNTCSKNSGVYDGWKWVRICKMEWGKMIYRMRMRLKD